MGPENLFGICMSPRSWGYLLMWVHPVCSHSSVFRAETDSGANGEDGKQCVPFRSLVSMWMREFRRERASPRSCGEEEPERLAGPWFWASQGRLISFRANCSACQSAALTRLIFSDRKILVTAFLDAIQGALAKMLPSLCNCAVNLQTLFRTVRFGRLAM